MDTRLKIISEIEKNREGIHLRELSRVVDSGLPNVKRFVDILEKENVVKKKRDANLLRIFLKESQKSLAYLKQVHTEKFLVLPSKIQRALKDFLNELDIKPLIVVVFGSYAKGNYNKNSDLDVLLIFQNVVNGKKIDDVSKRISSVSGVNLNSVYLGYSDFEKNFLDKNHLFSSEIRKEVIVFQGLEIYYNLLWRFLG